MVAWPKKQRPNSRSRAARKRGGRDLRTKKVGLVRQSCAGKPGKQRIFSDDHGQVGKSRNPAWILGLRLVEPAGAEGLEPPTYGFGDRRSTN
jgi:hypothetical protein